MKLQIFIPAVVCLFAIAMAPIARGEDITVLTDTTWRAYNHAPPAGWNTDLNFDDSDAAGWEDAVGSPNNNHIWYGSLKSADAPNNAWFRHVFTLTDPVTAGSGIFHFDDNGQLYINGQELIDDTGGGASNFNLTLDPGLFVVGQNLIAIHGVDTIAPDNSVGVDMTLTTAVPEPPIAAVGGMGMMIVLLLARRARRIPIRVVTRIVPVIILAVILVTSVGVPSSAGAAAKFPTTSPNGNGGGVVVRHHWHRCHHHRHHHRHRRHHRRHRHSRQVAMWRTLRTMEAARGHHFGWRAHEKGMIAEATMPSGICVK